MDLILDASWEECDVPFNTSSVHLKRGQLVTTTRHLMANWQTNGNTVRSFLRLLESDGMIACKKTTQYTLITINNYDAFQGDLELFMVPNFNRTRSRKRSHNKEKNNNNKNSSLNSEVSFFETLKEDEVFREHVAKQLSIEAAEVEQKLQAFKEEMETTEKSHKDISDYKSHFFNWTKLKVQTNKNSDGKKENTPGSQPSKRRGFEPNANSEEDYKGSF